MLSKTIGLKAYRFILLVGYVGIAISLPLNKVALSISTLWLVFFTLLEADFLAYFQTLKKSSVAKVLISLFALYLLSFLWSKDLQYALHDLNIKLPFFFLPLVILVHKKSLNLNFHLVFICFLASVSFLALLNFAWYNQWIGAYVYDDIRGLSRFISHIRFSLMVSFAMAISIYFYRFYRANNYKLRFLFLVLLVWLLYYTYYAQVLSGVLTTFAVLVYTAILEAKKQKNRVFTGVLISVGISLAVFCCVLLVYLFKADKPKISLQNLPLNTLEGNPYFHDYKNQNYENGYPIYCFINTKELRREWNKRAEIPLDSLDQKGQQIHGTILRYMTSKGLTKDAPGVHKLTDEDIRNIEMGIPSILFLQNGLRRRFYALKYELTNRGNPNGHSILQRFEYWKTGAYIFKENILYGTGVGDIQEAFDQKYAETQTKLSKENQCRTHNQFLTFGISLGILGLVLFVLLLSLFVLQIQSDLAYLGFSFFLIFVLSCLVEDTLETQMGVIFSAFFLGIFFQKKSD